MNKHTEGDGQRIRDDSTANPRHTGDPLEIPVFLRDWLADVWDEGYETGLRDPLKVYPDMGPHTNPYRVTPPEGTPS